MVSVVPGAIYSQLGKNYTVERWDYSKGLVLHVQEGNGRADNWFNHPDCNNASSHWWVGKDGTIRQFLDPENHQSWAQGDGNSEWHSVETEGFTGEPLTPAQIAGVATIYRWGMARFGWPAREANFANFVDDRGLGWHGMGGAAWGGHSGCPGNLRRAQRALIIKAATNSKTEEKSMDWNYVYANKVTNPNNVGFAETTWGTNYAAWGALNEVKALRAEVKELRAQVQQLLDIVGRLQ